MNRVGTILDGKYEILKEIGRGGMSIVYVAMDNRLRRQWAVKEIKAGANQSRDTLLKSLEMEANILKMVDHPVLPRIVDIIDEDGTIFVVMDYIEGRTLAAILNEEGAQREDKVIEWSKQLSSALDYLHSLNPPIIYRDMKPSNIMLKPDGTIKLIDFGTAKEYKEESLADTTALGTRGYAAPEQFGDEQGRGLYRTDARTDIYCLGATLYHIVTGMNPSEPPYEMKPIREWDKNLSSGFERIIKKCTKVNPDERYQSCKELLYDLDHYRELEDDYIKESKKKFTTFSAMVIMALLSLLICLSGYAGMNNERLKTYRSYIQQADIYKINGDYVEAAEMYTDAIDLDGKKSEAYIDLLSLYKNYLDVKEGLTRIEAYVNAEESQIANNNEVLYEIAITYFNELKDYKTSLKYFSMVDENEIEEAEYFKAISLALYELDFDKYTIQELDEFKEYNDKTVFSEDKLVNYKSLGIIYTTYIDSIDNAAQKTVSILEDALIELENLEDQSKILEYEIIYKRQIAIAYRYLGDNASNNPDAKRYYSLAISYSKDILELVSVDEDRSLVETKICDIAQMYEYIGDYNEAIEWYNKGEREFEGDSVSIYIGHLTLLCNIETEKTSDVTAWDSNTVNTILSIYDKASNINSIDSDVRWKRLIQKLDPLLELNGR